MDKDKIFKEFVNTFKWENLTATQKSLIKAYSEKNEKEPNTKKEYRKDLPIKINKILSDESKPKYFIANQLRYFNYRLSEKNTDIKDIISNMPHEEVCYIALVERVKKLLKTDAMKTENFPYDSEFILKVENSIIRNLSEQFCWMNGEYNSFAFTILPDMATFNRIKTDLLAKGINRQDVKKINLRKHLAGERIIFLLSSKDGIELVVTLDLNNLNVELHGCYDDVFDDEYEEEEYACDAFQTVVETNLKFFVKNILEK